MFFLYGFLSAFGLFGLGGDFTQSTALPAASFARAPLAVPAIAHRRGTLDTGSGQPSLTGSGGVGG
jgi:hypothetical protein